MSRAPLQTSFTYGPLFPTKTLALPALLFEAREIFSISRFIRICLEIDRRSAMHAASPFPGNVTSGEISVFLIARGKGREETFQKLYWKLRIHSSLFSSFRLPTRSSSRESIFEISSQTRPATISRRDFGRLRILDEKDMFYFFNYNYERKILIIIIINHKSHKLNIQKAYILPWRNWYILNNM